MIILKMGDREDKVYKAKLAEQAERYDGGFHLILPRQFILLLPHSLPPPHAPSLFLIHLPS